MYPECQSNSVLYGWMKELKIQKQPGYCSLFVFCLWLKIFLFRTKMCT